MFATTVGGYLMAKSALKASAAMSSDDADKAFLSTKISTAKFYAIQILPQVFALLGPATAGPESIFALSEDDFAA